MPNLRTSKTKRSRAVISALVGVAVLVSGYVVWQTKAADPFAGEAKHGTPAANAAGVGSGSPSSGDVTQSSAPATTPSAATPTLTATSTPKAKLTPKPASGLKTVKVMVLGDSISAGAQDEVMDGYRRDLLQKLPDYPIDYVGSYSRGDDKLADKDMQAEGGACIRSTPCASTNMYDQTAGWISAAKPNVVIMQGGGNDYCCGNQNKPDSVVIQAMTDWINLIWATKPDVYIVVIGMIDYHYGYKDWIPKYVARQAALGKHIYFVSFDQVATYDTVHPNVMGYQQLADRLAPVVKPIFNELLGR
jgi:lysophospholipase L1-like esterase